MKFRRSRRRQISTVAPDVGGPAAEPAPTDEPTREEVVVDEVDADDVDALIEQGRLVEAVDALAARARRAPDPKLDRDLVELRHRAAQELDPGPGRMPWPPQYADPFPDVTGEIPEVDASNLTPEMLGGAVAHHGALVVRGVFGREQTDRLVDVIETTHHRREDAYDESGELVAGFETPWYRPFPTTHHNVVLRRMVGRQGGTWLADSPSGTTAVLAELEAAGVTDAIGGHLGERPVFSLQKSTLRRSLPAFNYVAWHQDGSFLDADVRTMNVWVALSPCGGEQPSPGLEILPKRLPEILPVDGVMSKHAVSYDLVDELAEETPTVIPEFAAGDAILFDERLLHRTHLTEHMSETRYALECWFFAPSHPASTYIPLLV